MDVTCPQSRSGSVTEEQSITVITSGVKAAQLTLTLQSHGGGMGLGYCSLAPKRDGRNSNLGMEYWG